MWKDSLDVSTSIMEYVPVLKASSKPTTDLVSFLAVFLMKEMDTAINVSAPINSVQQNVFLLAAYPTTLRDVLAVASTTFFRTQCVSSKSLTV